MKIMKLLFTIVVSLIALSACSFNKLEDTKKDEISSEGITKLVIHAGSTNLHIKGDKDAKTIKVDTIIKRSSNVDKDTFIVKLQSKKNIANLDLKLKPLIFSISYRSMEAYVIVPEHISIDVTDGSQDTDISHITGDVKVDDGSGDLMLKNIDGDVIVKDGSGDISIQHVMQVKKIDDGSGSITLTDSGGPLDLKDGSGDIDIRQYTGDLSVDDGSGDFAVSDLNGSLEINDGSGDIDIERVEKNVTILDSGSGDLHMNHVKGNVSQ